MRRFLLPAVLLAAFVPSAMSAAPEAAAPQLRHQGTATQLIVNGQPFLIRGGELGNSTATHLRSLEAVWPKLAALNVNTALAPVYWDLLEPVEGRFDFTLVDGLVRQAREHRCKLVLLWFGSWKNSMSGYAPAWVKTDLQRFPRAQDSAGRNQEILSPFVAANRDADAHAFAALLRHVREIDAREQTVVMVQVENEIGMIPSARDHSPAATALFSQPVPAELLEALAGRRAQGALMPEFRDAWERLGAKTRGRWSEVFGDGAAAEEVFMAWHFGRYTDAVAAAGKAEYALPMFVNAALIRPTYQPGQYPSAGPLPHLFDIWRVAAPHIDLLAPDIYFPAFAEWTAKFARGGNPLFIPEALRSAEASVNALYAFGQHDAMGFCPFGIESIAEPAQSLLAGSFDLITQLSPLLLEHQGRGTSAGLLAPEGEQRQPQQIRIGEYVLNVIYERGRLSSLADGVIVPVGATGPAATHPAGGLVLTLGPDEYLIAGTGVTVTFTSADSAEQVGIVSAEEGRYVNGAWENILWLGGDQTHQGRHIRLEQGRFSIQRVKLYRYP